MATIRIKGYVYAEAVPAWHRKEGDPEFNVYVLPRKQADVAIWGVCVGEIDYTYLLPVGFDLAAETVRQKIESLEAQKADAARMFAETTARINREIANLQAIEYTPVAEAA